MEKRLRSWRDRKYLPHFGDRFACSTSANDDVEILEPISLVQAPKTCVYSSLRRKVNRGGKNAWHSDCILIKHLEAISLDGH
jgi:hypothetical protein